MRTSSLTALASPMSMSIRVKSGLKLPLPHRRPDTRFEAALLRFVAVLLSAAALVLLVYGSLAGAIAVSLIAGGLGLLWRVP